MKTISRDQYLTFIGLQRAHNHYRELLEALEKSAHDVLDEENTIGSHVDDIMWGERDLDEGLRLMGITVDNKEVPDLMKLHKDSAPPTGVKYNENDLPDLKDG